MTQDQDDAGKQRSAWANAGLLAGAVVLLFAGLGVRGLWGSENRWAEVTREMLLSGDFFHPTIGGLPYFDKPLLTYWLVGLASGLSGTLNEWAARAPSALAGLLAVWATMCLGRRLWSPQTGRLAGWLLLTSYGLLFWGRTADADIENLASVMLCVSWYWSRRDRPGFTAFLVFYLIAFLGALTKGLLAVVIPLCAILPDVVANRRWRSILTPSHAAALVVGLALYLAPFLYASTAGPSDYGASGLGLVFRENIQRFFAPFDHKDPVYTYFIHLPLLFLPWAPLLIIGLVSLLRHWKQLDSSTRWLLWATGTIFLFFTASGSRRGYYILPALPFCALLTAVFLAHLREAKLEAARRIGLTIQEGLLGFAIVLEWAALVALKTIGVRKGYVVPAEFEIATLVISVSGLAVWLLARRYVPAGESPLRSRLVAVVAGSAVLVGGWFCWQANVLDTLRAERPFARQLAQRATSLAGRDIGLFPRREATLLFYLNRKDAVNLIMNTGDLAAFLRRDEPRVLVSRLRDVPPDLQAALAAYPNLKEAVAPWDSARQRDRKWQAWFLAQPCNVAVEVQASEQRDDGMTERNQ